MTSKAVIEALKIQVSRHGILKAVVSDNGPQFATARFRFFAEKWNFTHTTSSPGYSQSIGKAESAVKAVKKLFQRAFNSKADPWLALLALRNTPMAIRKSSPDQLLFSKRCRSTLPTTVSLLQPAVVSKGYLTLVESKKRQAEQYNASTCELSLLTVGEPVRVQKLRGELGREKGKVKRVLPHRSYGVEVSGNQVVRRNRRFIRVSKRGKWQKAIKGDNGPSTTTRPKLKEKGSTEKSLSEIVLEPRARPQHQDNQPLYRKQQPRKHAVVE
jgi:hypothetical protein